jgi:excinuclease UvrABC nuclease subunit
MLDSPLLAIRGIGHKKLEKLFTEFDGPKELACQSPDTICNKIGVSQNISKEIIKVSKTLAN